MKNRKAFAVFSLYIVILSFFSCGGTSSEENKTVNISHQLNLADSFIIAGNYVVADSLSRSVFRTYNGEKDSVLFRALMNVYRIGRNTKDLTGAIRFMDSIYNSNDRIRKDYPHLLLGPLAHLLQLNGECDRALSVADEYCSLPAPKNRDIYIRTLEMVGYVYFYCSGELQKSINLFEKARNEYLNGAYSPALISILTRLAAFYRDNGQYEKAVQTNLEAIDFSLKSTGENRLWMVYGEMANTYNALGMFAEALDMNAEAIQFAGKDNAVLSNLYRFRSDIYIEKGRWDSVFHYLKKGEEASKAIGSLNGVYMNKLNELAVLFNFPDSMARARALADELCRDSAKVPRFLLLTLRYEVGQLLMKEGEAEKGVSLLASASDGFRELEWLNFEKNVLDCLMDGYEKNGMSQKLLSRFHRYRSLTDSLNRSERLKATAASYIRFDTERKEHRIKLLSAQVKLRTQSLHYNIGLSALLLLLLTASIAYIIIRRRAHRILLEASEHRLQSVLQKQKELNSKNELLCREIERTNLAVSSETMLQLTAPNLLSKEDEYEFRQAFSRLHPHFLNKIRSAYPSLTRTDELVIMLIYLNYKSDEIAFIMGINKTSVNITRSRIRKKMGLEKTDSLEDVIAGFKSAK